MKAIKIAVVMILALNLLYSLYGWLSPDPASMKTRSETGTSPQPASELQGTAADGLSLQGLTAMVKQVRSGEELERKLNQRDSINNLDLNGDQQVDYLFVREYGDPQSKIGYSLTAEPVKGEIQEVADVTIEKNGDTAEIQVIGNEQIYGPQAVYNDATSVERDPSKEGVEDSGMRMHSSYFFPHALWVSPFFFGYFPSFYRPYPVVNRSVYQNRVNRVNPSSVSRGRNPYQSRSSKSISNPNRGKVASKGIARSLKNPTATQRQFQVNRSRNLRSGGFGQTSRSAGVSSKPRSAGSSFGTSQRSSGSLLGRSASSSGSSNRSFRSSSFGSRSFSFGK